MTCAKCNHGFCWRCLKSWKPNHKDYYNCSAMVRGRGRTRPGAVMRGCCCPALGQESSVGSSRAAVGTRTQWGQDRSHLGLQVLGPSALGQPSHSQGAQGGREERVLCWALAEGTRVEPGLSWSLAH